MPTRQTLNLWQDRTHTHCIWQDSTKNTLWQNRTHQLHMSTRQDSPYDKTGLMAIRQDSTKNTLTMTKQDSPAIYVYPTRLTLWQDRTHTYYHDKTVLKTSRDKTGLPFLPDKTHSMAIQDSYALCLLCGQDSYALCLEWGEDSPWQYPAWWNNETSSPAWSVRFPARPANNQNVLKGGEKEKTRKRKKQGHDGVGITNILI